MSRVMVYWRTDGACKFEGVWPRKSRTEGREFGSQHIGEVRFDSPSQFLHAASHEGHLPGAELTSPVDYFYVQLGELILAAASGGGQSDPSSGLGEGVHAVAQAFRGATEVQVGGDEEDAGRG
jgi:hypothetical protein